MGLGVRALAVNLRSPARFRGTDLDLGAEPGARLGCQCPRAAGHERFCLLQPLGMDLWSAPAQRSQRESSGTAQNVSGALCRQSVPSLSLHPAAFKPGFQSSTTQTKQRSEHKSQPRTEAEQLQPMPLAPEQQTWSLS